MKYISLIIILSSFLRLIAFAGDTLLVLPCKTTNVPLDSMEFINEMILEQVNTAGYVAIRDSNLCPDAACFKRIFSTQGASKALYTNLISLGERKILNAYALIDEHDSLITEQFYVYSIQEIGTFIEIFLTRLEGNKEIDKNEAYLKMNLRNHKHHDSPKNARLFEGKLGIFAPLEGSHTEGRSLFGWGAGFLYSKSRFIFDLEAVCYSFDDRERIAYFNLGLNYIVLPCLGDFHLGAGFGIAFMYQIGYWNEEERVYDDTEETSAPLVYVGAGVFFFKNKPLKIKISVKYSSSDFYVKYHGIRLDLGLAGWLK